MIFWSEILAESALCDHLTGPAGFRYVVLLCAHNSQCTYDATV